MPEKILVCGGNGAGKSTFGRVLATSLGYVFRDIEDYYYPNRHIGEAYRDARSKQDVTAALLRDLTRHDKIIYVRDWLEGAKIPYITLDGTLQIEEMLRSTIAQIS